MVTACEIGCKDSAFLGKMQEKSEKKCSEGAFYLHICKKSCNFAAQNSAKNKIRIAKNKIRII